MVYSLIMPFIQQETSFHFIPLNNASVGSSLLCLAESLFFFLTAEWADKLWVAECFSESETDKCLPGHSGIMWHELQAGKHVRFSVLAFMWAGGVVSIFHTCHLGRSRAIILVHTGTMLKLACFSVVLENSTSHALCFLLVRSSSVFKLCLKKGVKDELLTVRCERGLRLRGWWAMHTYVDISTLIN